MQYVVDTTGHKTGVLISLEEYEHFLELQEEMEDIKDFDERVNSKDVMSLEEVEGRLGLSD